MVNVELFVRCVRAVDRVDFIRPAGTLIGPTNAGTNTFTIDSSVDQTFAFKTQRPNLGDAVTLDAAWVMLILP